ncbi:MAG: VCBS repeat-containing protein [Actinomycetia bacterium]|nr:VCBS repeat-containing protein [Actinomycetes bacterium]
MTNRRRATEIVRTATRMLLTVRFFVVIAVLAAEGSARAGTLPRCSASAGGGTPTSATPTLLATLSDRWHEAWLGSPAAADLDGDGTTEIIAARGDLVLGWHLDDTVVFRVQSDTGRFWAAPVVADLDPQRTGLEVAAAAADKLYVWDSAGTLLPGFPVTWLDELRAFAADDIDDDGAIELVVVSTQNLQVGGQRDIIMAWEMDGSSVAGFPPNTSGAAGCDDHCYVFGGFDQTLALGDVDGDGISDILATQDNAYMSLHRGTGWMFDANPVFDIATKFAGIRFLFSWASAVQGWPDDGDENQAHFTNSAPAIADLDDDGVNDLIVLGSVQDADQTDRYRGVALWVVHNDGTRLTGWETPYHVSAYLSGLWDLGNNIVAATNQVTVAEIDDSYAGPEMIFAGFDGTIHAVSSGKQSAWSYTYTTDASVLTGGVAVADLSGDGDPEVIFNSYSLDDDKSHLFVLGSDGVQQHKLSLPDRGAMPVPTIADVNGNGNLEIIVSLKDGIDHVRQVQVYTVSGSVEECLLWPTGRANFLRTGSPDGGSIFSDGFETGNLSRWSVTAP